MSTASFEAGKAYTTRSIGDADCIIRLTVERRTAKSIVTTEGKRLRIEVFCGVERVRPWGRYSMAPVISADRAA
jgi:hypothetical protein